MEKSRSLEVLGSLADGMKQHLHKYPKFAHLVDEALVRPGGQAERLFSVLRVVEQEIEHGDLLNFHPQPAKIAFSNFRLLRATASAVSLERIW